MNRELRRCRFGEGFREAFVKWASGMLASVVHREKKKVQAKQTNKPPNIALQTNTPQKRYGTYVGTCVRR